MAVTPKGVTTGFGLAPASAKEQPIVENFFLQAYPNPRFVSTGHTGRGQYYPADKDSEGRENQQRWEQVYGARVIYPRQAQQPTALAQGIASLAGRNPSEFTPSVPSVPP